MTGYTGSVWIDTEPVLVGVPLQPDLNVQDRPEIFLARGESIPVELWIDDVEVRFLDASRLGKDTKDVAFRQLFGIISTGMKAPFSPAKEAGRLALLRSRLRTSSGGRPPGKS